MKSDEQADTSSCLSRDQQAQNSAQIQAVCQKAVEGSLPHGHQSETTAIRSVGSIVLKGNSNSMADNEDESAVPRPRSRLQKRAI